MKSSSIYGPHDTVHRSGVVRRHNNMGTTTIPPTHAKEFAPDVLAKKEEALKKISSKSSK